MGEFHLTIPDSELESRQTSAGYSAVQVTKNQHIILDILNESEILHNLKKKLEDFPGGLVVKNLPANVGDMGSIPGPGRSHMARSS